jgi:hypothetical protein
MMSYEEFKIRYPHCKSWDDCKTQEEQCAFIFGWGSIDEIVSWTTENASKKIIDFALKEFFERGKCSVQQAPKQPSAYNYAATLQRCGSIAELAELVLNYLESRLVYRNDGSPAEFVRDALRQASVLNSTSPPLPEPNDDDVNIPFTKH